MDRAKQCLVCPKCKAEEPLEKDIVYSKSRSERDKIVVIGREEQNLMTKPQIKMECPKCGNN
ncbi:MAG: transcription factor S, partial [Candidatus Bathyarchaeia archaeon]